jgi:hypothetical protein
LTSCESPYAGTPHFDASLATFRIRQVNPSSQLDEQGDHCDHNAQAPSEQSLQATLLHFATCSSLLALHVSAPALGARVMPLLRVFMPPPQLRLQSPHFDHLPQTHCVIHDFSFLHGLVSDMVMWHGAPESVRFLMTLRLRID